MAMQSFFTLAVIAKQWDAKVVLPFTRNSYLYGLPARRRHSLDLLYDKVALKRLSLRYNISTMTSFDEFILSASRNVVYLELYYNLKEDSQGRHIYSTDRCSRNSRELLSQLNIEVHKRNLTPFHVTHCCHIMAKHVTTPLELQRSCSMHKIDNFTIVIKQWRGYTRDPNRRYRLYMPDFEILHPGPHVPLPHSKEVIDNANKLLGTRIMPEQKFIGVHLRSQKLMLKSKQTIHSCMEMTQNLSRELVSTHPGLPVIYFGDPYTSMTVGPELSKHNIKLLQFKKGMFGSVRDEGFQAQVDQHAAAMAEVLVLVGGASFQFQIYVQYQLLANSGVAYRICDQFIENYLSVTKWSCNSTKPWVN